MGIGVHRFKRASKNRSQLAQGSTIEYIVLYWWAFSIVDFLWQWLYTELTKAYNGNYGPPLAYNWLLNIPMLGIAGIIAWCTPGHDFYAPRAYGMRTTTHMLMWAINFVTWWAWGQTQSIATKAMFESFDLKNDVIGAVFSFVAQLMFFVALILIVGIINTINAGAVLRANQAFDLDGEHRNKLFSADAGKSWKATFGRICEVAGDDSSADQNQSRGSNIESSSVSSCSAQFATSTTESKGADSI